MKQKPDKASEIKLIPEKDFRKVVAKVLSISKKQSDKQMAGTRSDGKAKKSLGIRNSIP